jgi:hypothetical protein
VFHLAALCIGGIVGWLLAQGLEHISNLNDWKVACTYALTVAFGGTAVPFCQKLVGSNELTAFCMYPLGLGLAFFYDYLGYAVKLVASDSRTLHLLGVLHVGVVVLGTFFTIALCFPKVRTALFGD